MGHPTQRREHDAMAVALEQQRTQSRFEFTNLQRKRRLGNMDALRGPAERAILDHRLEVAQLTQVTGKIHLFRSKIQVQTGARLDVEKGRRPIGMSRSGWASILA